MRRIAQLLAVVVVVAVGASCSKAPDPEVERLRTEVDMLKKQLDEAMARAAVEYTGTVELHNQGSACKIKSKSPDPLKVRAGSWVTWTVTNGCRQEAKLTVQIVGPGAGNRSDAANPLSITTGDPIAAGQTGPVVWRIKTKAELNPRPGNTPDRWSYKWRINNAVQQDPELEVEY